MAEISTSRLRDLVSGTVGPTPWYWSTFPEGYSVRGQRFVWTHHGEQGALRYVVSLGLEEEPDKPRLALNTYCRPFHVAPGRLGVWCPEGRSIRVVCFDLEQLKAFDPAEIAGWFKQSSERIYAATTPISEFELPPLKESTHNIEVPLEFQTVDELIIPTSYPAMDDNAPAFALYVVYLRAGLVEVLPQKWFTRSQYDVGPKWITRAARDPESHRIAGECFGVGIFLLEEDGCRLERWVERRDPW
ncbi:MAG: hypothetical protein LAO09_16145 [Acidobacteriia bacterium]|nr:hypothetical protein [Terriglobia bacterium]